MINNYKTYKFHRKEKIRCMLEGMVLNGIIGKLFYDSWWAMLPGIVLAVLYYREKKRYLAHKRLERMRVELKEFFQLLIVALQTGRSIENAFGEALKDLKKYSGKDTELVQELQKICAGVSVGEPLEKQLMEFADRSGLEELEYFSEVFSVAKRSGGNMIGIMKNTIYMLQERMDAEAEIRTVVTEKRVEFYVMSVIPLVMIVYLRVSAGGFLNALYGNQIGIITMTICLGIYGGCFLYGKKLLEFEF